MFRRLHLRFGFVFFAVDFFQPAEPRYPIALFVGFRVLRLKNVCRAECAEFFLRFRFKAALAAARTRAVPKWSFCFRLIRFAMFFFAFLPCLRAGFAMIVSS